jgi:hypothetical protein
MQPEKTPKFWATVDYTNITNDRYLRIRPSKGCMRSRG